MDTHVDVVAFIFQLIALVVPIIFIIFLSFFWRSPKIRKDQSNPIDKKFNSMGKKN